MKLFVVFSLVLLPFLTYGEQLKPCELPPDWEIDGVNPLKDARNEGHVVLLALLKASCPYCQSQVAKLKHMKRILERRKEDVSFMVVNLATEKDNIKQLEDIVKGHFPIYQDTTELDIWTKMKGKKDTMYIFDRCGYLHEQIDHPHSRLVSKKNSEPVHHLKMALKMKYDDCSKCKMMDHAGHHHDGNHNEDEEEHMNPAGGEDDHDDHKGHNHKKGEDDHDDHDDHKGHNHKKGEDEHDDHQGHNHKVGEHDDHHMSENTKNKEIEDTDCIVTGTDAKTNSEKSDQATQNKKTKKQMRKEKRKQKRKNKKENSLGKKQTQKSKGKKKRCMKKKKSKKNN